MTKQELEKRYKELGDIEDKILEQLLKLYNEKKKLKKIIEDLEIVKPDNKIITI